MGKKQTQYPRCVDCGRHAGIVQCTDGRICRPCQDDRNDRIDGLLTNGVIAVQPVDPDDAARPCGNGDCTVDATTVLRFHQPRVAAGTVHMFACNDHIIEAVAVATQAKDGDLSSVGRVEHN